MSTYGCDHLEKDKLMKEEREQFKAEGGVQMTGGERAFEADACGRVERRRWGGVTAGIRRQLVWRWAWPLSLGLEWRMSSQSSPACPYLDKTGSRNVTRTLVASRPNLYILQVEDCCWMWGWRLGNSESKHRLGGS